MISQNTLMYQRKYSIHISYLYSKSLYLKLLVSQSKLSGIRKYTLKYKLSEMNFVFEISRVECRRQKYSFSVYSVDKQSLTNVYHPTGGLLRIVNKKRYDTTWCHINTLEGYTKTFISLSI